jgi:hypothetical protein
VYVLHSTLTKVVLAWDRRAPGFCPSRTRWYCLDEVKITSKGWCWLWIENYLQILLSNAFHSSISNHRNFQMLGGHTNIPLIRIGLKVIIFCGYQIQFQRPKQYCKTVVVPRARLQWQYLMVLGHTFLHFESAWDCRLFSWFHFVTVVPFKSSVLPCK